ncbi:hypothetical protein [Sulfurimonas sp. NW9]|uniref:hypothetical protein n=1 Tax=Sulfurimonas sp. NW9 TaxID=2922728 RepID=UPI003DA8DF1C
MFKILFLLLLSVDLFSAIVKLDGDTVCDSQLGRDYSSESSVTFYNPRQIGQKTGRCEDVGLTSPCYRPDLGYPEDSYYTDDYLSDGYVQTYRHYGQFTCVEPTPCTDTPPDNLTGYPLASGGSCAAVSAAVTLPGFDIKGYAPSLELSLQTSPNYTLCSIICDQGYYEKRAVCSSDEVVNSDNKCIKKDLVVNIPESDCVPGTVFNDYSKGFSGVLSWDVYLKSCVVVEDKIVPCSEYTPTVIKEVFNCDTDLNNFNFSCTDNLNDLPTIETSCTPKNESVKVSPCNDFRKSLEQSCKDSGKIIDPSSVCEDNGIVITKNTLSCIVPKPKCDGVWGEVYNPTTNECDCKEGYYKDRFGNCSYDFFGKADENLTDEEKNQKISNEISNATTKKQAELSNDLNSSFSSTASGIIGLGNDLSGLRSDINTTNNILNDIKDKFEDEKLIDVKEEDLSLLNAAKDFLDGATQQYKDFYENTKNVLDSIESKYDEAIALFHGEAPSSVLPSGSTSDCFKTTVFGHEISFDLCSSFGYLSPIIYVVLNIYFMILVFFFSLKYTLRSFS